uniref:Uncharacterized protein n=1 Tax=Aegilops tauschii subsp. strangulata TaxID=200361 RepID=A0A452XE00_AEGTS
MLPGLIDLLPRSAELSFILLLGKDRRYGAPAAGTRLSSLENTSSCRRHNGVLSEQE